MFKVGNLVKLIKEWPGTNVELGTLGYVTRVVEVDPDYVLDNKYSIQWIAFDQGNTAVYFGEELELVSDTAQG